MPRTVGSTIVSMPAAFSSVSRRTAFTTAGSSSKSVSKLASSARSMTKTCSCMSVGPSRSLAIGPRAVSIVPIGVSLTR